MHSDIHLVLHHQRAAELQNAVAAWPLPRTPLRTQVGWALVELGLKLAVPSAPTRPLPRPA